MNYIKVNAHYEHKNLINNLLNEEDIILLQNIFLKKGKSEIILENSANYSVFIIESILNSLNCYKNIAILTENIKNFSIPFNIIDYKFSNEQDLECYLLNDFNYDFLLIEISHKLNNNFFKAFIDLLDNFFISDSIPVVIIK